MAATCVKKIIGMNLMKTTLISTGQNVLWNFSAPMQCRCWHSLQLKKTYGTARSMADEFKRATRHHQHLHTLCRTSESDPSQHTTSHAGLFYTVSKDEFNKWLSKGLAVDLYRQMKAFNENCIMVRPPALEVMSYMKRANYNLPVVRYLLYGRTGAGKSVTLSHIMHYCGTQGWLLLHVPWGAHYNRYSPRAELSTYKAGRYDQPLVSAEWLANFKRMNGDLLKTLNPTLKNRYVWTKREASELGSTWTEMIDFGLSRAKYASDVMGAILKETRLLSSEGSIQALVAFDGVNSLWANTNVKQDDNWRNMVGPESLTTIHNWKKMIKNDWSGGAVVMTVDVNAGNLEDMGSYMPGYLLGKEGFEMVDPHIPVHVPDYNDKEIHSALEYYQERHWISNPKGVTEDGKKEIIFLSCHNPGELFNVTAAW